MKRFFSFRQRVALFLAADGKCESCGVELPQGWHADHIKAWSKGGATDVANGQALCAECNQRKGNVEVMTWDKLRRWQRRFVENFRAWVDATFLLVALPGGGKTIAALYSAKEWLGNFGSKQRVIVVVVPTRNLKRQWRGAARKRFGLDLQTKEFDGSIKPGMNGCVITYSAVASDSMLFRRLCAKHEVLVIFDEVHHVGGSAAWGEGVREAFEGATKRLAMSGTPWRSDGSQIPFLEVNSETGEYEHQERFDWPEALTEEPPAVRLLAFKPYHGFAEYADGDNVIRLNSRDTLSDDDVARCLKGRLLEQRFCTDMLRDAHDKLMSLREDKPDAAGIIVCIDITHAQKVASWLRDVTGEEAVIAVSDDEVATDNAVESFGATGALGKWIVSVRQVSEGVDIPRLMVGVYLTNYTTELFFRQFVGRVGRYQGTEHDKEAYVYYPAHPNLDVYAAKILELQAVGITLRSNEPKDRISCGGFGASPLIYLGGSDAESGGAILPMFGEHVPPSEARSISEFAKRYGIPETTAARIRRDLNQEEASEDMPTDEFDAEPLEERLERMRVEQNKRVGYWARLSGRPYDHLNNEANEHAGCASVKTATEEQLKRRRIFIEQRIRDAKSAA